ncbi:hypothetical protein Bca101_023255 [Brassica carinata]
MCCRRMLMVLVCGGFRVTDEISIGFGRRSPIKEVMVRRLVDLEILNPDISTVKRRSSPVVGSLSGGCCFQ